MNIRWSIPIITAYLYAVTILTQYGFSTYFNIPSSFIEVSIKDNVIYFFQLFQLATNIAGLMSLWMWIIIVVVMAIIFLFYDYSFILNVIVLFFAGLVLWQSYGFGRLIAANTSSFYALSDDCLITREDSLYIIPNFYQGAAILIPISKNNNKIIGNFLIKDISSLGCAIERKEVGKISN
ncbi:MAG: hypothetical protein ACD_15C00137G0014 [uncultured bacterium]|nr:MAG: hypothetical protein ACD_15C00137G0014 [uncultured bacterium]